MVLLLKLSERFYLKDPQSSELGGRIITSGVKLIDEMGFEAFTFKKLSIEINSTEASIYRYFENKHRFLVYLIAWYWAWIEYKIEFNTHNISDPKERLGRTIQIMVEEKVQDDAFPDVDEKALQRIIISESDKSYLTKQVDQDNKEGLFKGYKSLCSRISTMIAEVNPDYPYPHALASTVLEASNQQIFFAQHLPSLTEVNEDADVFEYTLHFIKSLVFNAIGENE